MSVMIMLLSSQWQCTGQISGRAVFDFRKAGDPSLMQACRKLVIV
ncbi:hypothetical protein [Legionella yabuuchiae]|nr:hypothetical protein [Legionella yabuuchiae]